MLAMPPIHSTSLQFVAGLYVFAGLAVKGIALFRGLKIRRSHFIGEPVWDSRDNSGDSLFMFLAATDWHPVGIVFQILLWPIWFDSSFSTQRVQNMARGDDSSR